MSESEAYGPIHNKQPRKHEEIQSRLGSLVISLDALNKLICEIEGVPQHPEVSGSMPQEQQSLQTVLNETPLALASMCERLDDQVRHLRDLLF